MKVADLPPGSIFLDVDGIAVVMLPPGPKGNTCSAFVDGKGLDVGKRPANPS